MAHGHLLFPQALQAFAVDLDARGNGGTRRVVPEDVTHVVQQARGRRQATTLSKPTAGSTIRRFAWIKAGRISDEDFYAWSERASAQKKKYDEGAITLEDFQRWLEAS